MTWAFLEGYASMVRRSGADGVVTGLDYVQLFALAEAQGLPTRVLAKLLPACELGILDAMHEAQSG